MRFLPIGKTWQVMFEANGDLLTSGKTGVRRWTVQLDSDRNELRVGPPRELPFPYNAGQIAEDWNGQIVTIARRHFALVQASGRQIELGLLDDCRYVAVSPDGEWLATGSHHQGAEVWRVRDFKQVAEIPVETGTAVFFSPNGKYLMTSSSPCKLWTTGTWAHARQARWCGALLLSR